MLLFYISFWRHHCELHLMRWNESIILKICFCLKIWHMPAIYWTSKGKVIDELLLCFHLSILNFVVVVVHGVNLSLASEVTCISVSPGFLMAFPMILVQGLWMTLTVAYIDFSICVGKCSIDRPSFSQGLVGWDSLPSYL